MWWRSEESLEEFLQPPQQSSAYAGPLGIARGWLFDCDVVLSVTGRRRSNALAFAANQHAGDGVRGVASFGERGIGTVPAGVVGIVA
jgi:hypothetical protein